MFRNLLNYLNYQTASSLPVILRGMLDQFRDRGISDFTRKHETIAWEMPEAWRAMKPADLDLLLKDFSLADQLLILELASFHRSGYIRQKSVELLSQIQIGTELRCLLIRLNDWVDNVALVASLSVKNRLVNNYRAFFLNELPFVLHLHATERRNNSEVLRSILELIVGYDLEQLLTTTQKCHSERTLREFFRLCLQLEINGVADLVRSGLNSNDPYIRSCSIDYVAKIFSAREQLQIATERYGDNSVAVRRIALLIKVQCGGSTAQTALQQSLFDQAIPCGTLPSFILSNKT